MSEIERPAMGGTTEKPAGSSWIQRYVLPGLAFKAVVIGGGYATGREIAEFFLPSGPAGGLLAILVATIEWSLVCALTFRLAHRFHLSDYRAFFGKLLGRFWPIFEIVYVALVLVILSVFGAAAGVIGHALFGWPDIAGTLLLLISIAVVVGIGAVAVEPLFKWVSVLLYITYALFLSLSLWKFGPQIEAHLHSGGVGRGWLMGGITYAGYNSFAAVVILPVLRHMHSERDAVIAGLAAGPLAMIPGLFFFLAMIAWYPEVGASALPSDYLLMKIDIPAVRFLFQAMIFFALLESGTGAIHAIMERVRRAMRHRTGRDIGIGTRAVITLVVLTLSVFAAQGIGLVALIAQGYRAMSWILIAIFILPLAYVSIFRRNRGTAEKPDAS